MNKSLINQPHSHQPRSLYEQWITWLVIVVQLIALGSAGAVTLTSPTPVWAQPPAPDLTISKSGPATATQHVPYSYTLTVNNTGAVATGSGSGASIIRAGGVNTCAITSQGGVKCWGRGIEGQNGNGATDLALEAPTDVTGLTSGVSTIEMGYQHTCAVTSSGGLKCWGNNGTGQIGDGTNNNQRLSPVDVVGLTSGVSTVSAGQDTTCAVMTSGGVKCWGWNPYGQLGNGTQTTSYTPVDVSGLTSGAKTVAVGVAFACALTTSGGVKCWGINTYGQAGDGTTNSGLKLTPVDVVGLTSGVAAITAGDQFACALTTSGGVKCWGNNGLGQLGDGTTTSRNTPVNVSGLNSGVMAIDAGDQHTCALTTNGGMKCWGRNDYSQLGDGTSTQRNTPVAVAGLPSTVTAIAAGMQHSCAVTNDNGAFCWGRGGAGELGEGLILNRTAPVRVTGLPVRFATPPSALSAGGRVTCAVTSSGGAKCWGYGQYGQIGDGENNNGRDAVTDVSGLSSGVATLANSDRHTCALTSSGGVKCWGYNGVGQLGDGTVTNRNTPVDVTGLTSGVIAIANGDQHTCALTSSGGVKCWGDNQRGQVGDGTQTQRHTPVDVSGLTSGVMAITAGENYTCALTTGGGVKCWGLNQYGEVGDSTSNNQRLTPVDVTGLTSGVIAIDASDFSHTCALTSGGGVKCWGLNGYGQLGDGTTTNRSAPVDVSGLSSGVTLVKGGQYHTCVLTSNGGVKCWGNNGNGQLGDGTTTAHHTPTDVSGLTSGVTALAAGSAHNCATLTSGLMKCWGWNQPGQLGDGTALVQVTTPKEVALLISGPGASASGSGMITVTDVLPAGLTFVATGSGGNGWSCTASGQTVTCTSSTSIAAGGSSAFPLVVNPTTTGVLNNSATVVGGGDTTPATSNTVNTTVNGVPTATPTSTPTTTPTNTPTSTPTSVFIAASHGGNDGFFTDGIVYPASPATNPSGAFNPTGLFTSTPIVEMGGWTGNPPGSGPNNILETGNSGSESTFLADVTSDGKLDIIYINTGGNAADSGTAVWTGDGDGTFNHMPIVDVGSFGGGALPTGTNNQIVAGTSNAWQTWLADVNNDGKQDVVFVRDSTAPAQSGTLVWLGNGNGTWQHTPIVEFGSFTGTPAGTIFPNIIRANVTGGSSAYLADANNDGKVDLIYVDQNSNSAPNSGTTVWFGNGDGTFNHTPVIDKGSFTGFSTFNVIKGGNSANDSTFVGDFNGDGKVDIAYITNGGGAAANSGTAIWLGNGNGTFQHTPIVDKGAFTGLIYAFNNVIGAGEYVGSAWSTRVVDFNNDGKLDVLWTTAGTGSINSTAAVWAGNGDGTFSHTPIIQRGGFTSNLPGGVYNNVIGGGLGGADITLYGDVNGDGQLDTLYINEAGTSTAGTAVWLGKTAATAAPSLVIGKSGPATATQGTNFNYTLVVTNTGTAATSGAVTVADTLAAGLSFVSGSGGGFICTASGQTVTCTSSTAIAINGTATINLTVNPATTGAKSNTASVVGGGDASAATSNTVNTTVNGLPMATPTNTPTAMPTHTPTATPTNTPTPPNTPTATPTSTPIINGGIEYKIVYNGTTGRYEVYMRPNITPGMPNQTGTAQVTLKVPHVAGSGAFTIMNLLPYTATTWVLSSRVNAPVEAPSYDYLSLLVDFPTNQTGTFNWQNGVERLAFSFVNGGLCAGSIEIMENSDPFNLLPNSADTNPGNEISVTGLGNDPNNDYLGTYGHGQATCSTAVRLPVKLLLHGAYDSSSGLMRDALRSLPDFPLTSPYGDGATITNTNVLSVAGNNAIVDWVLVELHHPVISSTIVISQAALLQRDGDLVAVDGVSPLMLTPASNNYYVAVHHRNHLGTMTASPLLLSTSTPLIDFTTMSATAGSHGQRLLNTTYLLWAGDASGDNRVIGAGPGNDLNPIRATVFAAPGNVNYNRNYTVAGYSRADLNLDGLTTAAGPGDDTNYIYNSIFLHPANFSIAVNYIIQEQLP